MDALEECEDDEKIDWLSTHPSHKARQKSLEDLLHHANTLRNICEVGNIIMILNDSLGFLGIIIERKNINV